MVVPIFALLLVLPVVGWMGILIGNRNPRTGLNDTFVLCVPPFLPVASKYNCRLWFSATVAEDIGVALSLIYIFSTFHSSYPSTTNLLKRLSLRAGGFRFPTGTRLIRSRQLHQAPSQQPMPR
jgi:hypothetical protein